MVGVIDTSREVATPRSREVERWRRPTATPVVDVITDYAAFLALAPEWNDTVRRAGVPHPFLSHEWLRTWWDCFAGDAHLHIVVVRERNEVGAGRIIAIAPLLLESARMYGIPIRRLRLLQNDHTPRTDFIVAEQAGTAYQAIWQTLFAHKSEWDVLQLSQLPRESATLTAFASFASAEGLSTGNWASGESPYLELRGTWDQYWNGLSAKFRSNVRNRLTRLSQIGVPDFEMLDDATAIAAARQDSIRLEASDWKEQEGTAITSDPSVQRFYAELPERAVDAGWLRLLFLTVDGRRIATSFSAIYDNRLFLLKTGYDPEFAKCSPFKLLTSFAVQAAYADGLAEVDFLGDTEPWKQEWTPATRAHDWLYVFSDTMRARLVHRAKFQVAPAVRQWRA
jgi:CelD/BcsL family acetyltransferase involved in cellulose biosynthesis